MSDDRKPPSRRLSHAAAAVVLVILALIVLIFVGLNLSHLNDKTHERAVPAPQGGVQQITPPPNR